MNTMSNLFFTSSLDLRNSSANFGVKFRHGGHQWALKKRFENRIHVRRKRTKNRVQSFFHVIDWLRFSLIRCVRVILHPRVQSTLLPWLEVGLYFHSVWTTSFYTSTWKGGALWRILLHRCEINKKDISIHFFLSLLQAESLFIHPFCCLFLFQTHVHPWSRNIAHVRRRRKNVIAQLSSWIILSIVNKKKNTLDSSGAEFLTPMIRSKKILTSHSSISFWVIVKLKKANFQRQRRSIDVVIIEADAAEEFMILDGNRRQKSWCRSSIYASRIICWDVHLSWC